MVENKFSAIFQNSTAAQKAPQRIEKAPSAAKPLGRPRGKRSDPAWKQFSVLLKKETQREAAKILRDKDEGQDLSALIQDLLVSWIKRQKS